MEIPCFYFQIIAPAVFVKNVPLTKFGGPEELKRTEPLVNSSGTREPLSEISGARGILEEYLQVCRHAVSEGLRRISRITRPCRASCHSRACYASMKLCVRHTLRRGTQVETSSIPSSKSNITRLSKCQIGNPTNFRMHSI
jgi:hypothetical protein